MSRKKKKTKKNLKIKDIMFAIIIKCNEIHVKVLLGFSEQKQTWFILVMCYTLKQFK